MATEASQMLLTTTHICQSRNLYGRVLIQCLVAGQSTSGSEANRSDERVGAQIFEARTAGSASSCRIYFRGEGLSTT